MVKTYVSHDPVTLYSIKGFLFITNWIFSFLASVSSSYDNSVLTSENLGQGKKKGASVMDRCRSSLPTAPVSFSNTVSLANLWYFLPCQVSLKTSAQISLCTVCVISNATKKIGCWHCKLRCSKSFIFSYAVVSGYYQPQKEVVVGLG